MRRSRSRELLALAMGAVALAGCKHDITGPAPTIASPVDPHLVCNQQITTRVTINGSGFSPLPIDTATQPPELALPGVSFVRQKDLTNAAVQSATTITVPDDPSKPSVSQVHWTSQSVMAMDVTPGLFADTGIYAMTITNRNGNSASRDAAIAVVPPPTLSGVKPMAICDAQHDVTLELDGANFLVIHDAAGDKVPTVTLTDGTTTFTYSATVDESTCTALPAPATEASLCTRMTITVSQGMVPPGSYSVTVTNPAPASCATTEPITVDVVPPPSLTSAAPAKLCAGGGTLSLTGTDFRAGASVYLSGHGATQMDATTVTVPVSTSATAVFGGGLVPNNPGESYDLTIANPEGCTSTLPNEITVVQGPILYFADPPIVYGAITMQVTLYASGLTGTPTAVKLTPSGGGTTIDVAQFSVDSKGRVVAVLPAGSVPVGTYDIEVDDPAGCAAVLPMGVRVTTTLDASITNIDPAFAWNQQYTSVAIDGSGANGAPFTGSERIYIQLHGATSTAATALRSVSKFSDTRLTALVPPGLAAGAYDVILVTADGHVALDSSGLSITTAQPPVIDSATPGQVITGGMRSVSVVGAGFNNPTAVWTCEAWPSGTQMKVNATVSGATTTSATVSLDTTNIPATGNNATACVLRLTNPDGAYGDYSVVSVNGSAGNISSFESGVAMKTARRAPAVAVGHPTRSARFLYAIGGDDGTTTGALPSEEFVSIDEFGQMGMSWQAQPYSLPKPITLASAQRIGRFIYLVGGTKVEAGTPAASNEVYRAQILDPLDSPQISDLSAVRKGAATEPGLGSGLWYYRVSAVFPGTDANNPGGESLAGDPFPVSLPAGLPDQLFLTIEWPHVAGATAYNVYASPTANADASAVELIATWPNSGTGTQSYIDKGVRPATATQGPLPLGAHGKWATMPSLANPRSALGLTQAADPVTSGVHYLYAIGGNNASSAPQGTYELLAITDAGATQTVPGPWVPGASAFTTTPRAELSAAAVTSIESAVVTSGTWVYAGPGRTATGVSADVQAAFVVAGGQLCGTVTAGVCTTPAWINVETSGSQAESGYAWCIANNTIYTFFGAATSGTATGTALSSGLCGNAGITCTPSSVNVAPYDKGFNGLAAITGTQTRYLPGSAVENGFIFVVGGVDMANAPLTTTTLDLL